VIGERGPGGFQTKEEANKAHWALERLGYLLPREIMATDDAMGRESKIMMRWPNRPLSPPEQLLKRLMLDKEP
jgi:hypothetical protein